MLGIIGAKNVSDESRALPRHFKEFHNCGPTGLRIRGNDRVYSSVRGGDINRVLTLKNPKWIVTLNTLQPIGLNETINFSAFI